MKKKNRLVAVGLMLALLTGCGAGGKEASSTVESEGEIGDVVNIEVWGGRISDEVYEDFEKKYGCHVNVSYVTNTDEQLAKLISGNCDMDLIHVEMAYIKTFVEAGVLEVVNKDNIPNEKYLKKSVYNGTDEADTPYLISDGFDPGYTVLVYNKEICPKEITKFSDLSDSAFKGQVSLPESTISLFSTALADLGYSSCSTNEDEIKKAYELLMDVKPNLKAVNGNSAIPMLENGDVSVALVYQSDWTTLMANPDNQEKFALAPMEGIETGPVFWCIPKGAEHKEAAEALANFMIEPEEYAKSFSAYPQLSGMETKYFEEFVSEDVLSNPALTMPDYITEKAFYNCVTPELVSVLDKYYTLFKSSTN